MSSGKTIIIISVRRVRIWNKINSVDFHNIKIYKDFDKYVRKLSNINGCPRILKKQLHKL